MCKLTTALLLLVVGLSVVVSMVTGTSTDPHRLNAAELPLYCAFFNFVGDNNSRSPFEISNMTVVKTNSSSSSSSGGLSSCEDVEKPSGYLFRLPAYGKWNASLLDLGWDYLEVTGIIPNNSVINNKHHEKKQQKPMRNNEIASSYSPPSPFESAHYSMGLFEGFVTADRMKYILNISISPGVSQWLDQHITYIQKKVSEEELPKDNNPFWNAVGTLIDQMQGLADGYNLATFGTTTPTTATTPNNNTMIPATLKKIFIQNMHTGELGDIERALEARTAHPTNSPGTAATYCREERSSNNNNNNFFPASKAGGTHCSALVKVTNDDLFVAHSTWLGFDYMAHRIFKVYRRCSLNDEEEKREGNLFYESSSSSFRGREIKFGSYPGSIQSGDDWYRVLDRSASYPTTYVSLIVTETTNFVFNSTLYLQAHPESVSEFLRVMAAMWLAVDAEEWVSFFKIENSGTLNNQWIVVDLLGFTPSSSSLSSKTTGAPLIANGTLWIAEQIPGYIEARDMSDHLKDYGYWASYNIPYFKHIFDISGYQAEVDAVGSYWSYSHYARPEIFRRNQSSISNLSEMMKMMRYNDYEHDGYSLIPNCTGAGGGGSGSNNNKKNRCSPRHSSMLSIASRGDLMKVYPSKEEMMYHYGPIASFMAQGCFGAIDSKIGSWQNRYNTKSWAISGPTNDQQPTFSYGGPGAMGQNCPVAPDGSPVTFDFPWLEIDG